MNSIRHVVESIFQTPIERMSFIAYFQYLNTSGKITPRSLLELATTTCTFLEEQEKENAQFRTNFTEIEEILKKLVEKKIEPESATVEASLPEVIKKHPELKLKPDKFSCMVCGREFAYEIAMKGHSRTHNKKAMV